MSQVNQDEPNSGFKGLKSPTRLLFAEESIDDDFEDDDDHKKPLIKPGGRLVLSNGRMANGKHKVRFNLSNSSQDSHDEDDDDVNTENSSRKSKHSLNIPPPITIGKIKIFKPSRSHRTRRFCRFFKKFCTLIFIIAFLVLLLTNLKNLPEIIQSMLGMNTYVPRVGRKDLNSKCDQVVSEAIWRQNYPMLTIESALRLIDVNNDTVIDVIVPFGTGIDAAYYDPTLCQIYFNQTDMESKTIGCGGGVVAIDGKTGDPIWGQYTAHELFASNCDADLNNDGAKDCVIAGRMASLFAFDGPTGRILWSITSNFGDPVSETSNFYTPLLVPKDVDGDSVPELVVMHGGDPLRKSNEKVRNVAKLMVISGKTGRILTWSYVPGNAESYYSPQLLVHPDGTLLVLFGTGGETHPGALYVVSLEALFSGKLEHNSRIIFEDCCKGVTTPPVLIDITGDQILDIVMAHFNSTVIAFDGLTFEKLWQRDFPGSETYSTPTVGYFNKDDIPDFGVIYQFGPGFPIYYRAEFHVLDGRNGQSLRDPVVMPIGTQSSPLTISTLAANDIFLFWYSSCSNSTISKSNKTNDEVTDKSIFQIQSANVHESSRADFCKLRYGENTQHFTQYRAITPDSMTTLYDSRIDEPDTEKMNFTEIAYKWFMDNLPRFASASEPAENLYANTNDLSPDEDALNKFKKWRPETAEEQEYPYLLKKFKRHVGLHNGDSIQRVISTGTLAPSLSTTTDQLPVDGSIDIIFATYSFPPSTIRKMSDAMRKCLQSYLNPEKETEMRLMDDNSPFKRLGYDHDAYEAAVNELCTKQTGDANVDPNRAEAIPDPVEANDWLRQMGSMTVHRLNLKCFDKTKKQQIPIKEYRYQRWPSYLGLLADAVVNMIDE